MKGFLFLQIYTEAKSKLIKKQQRDRNGKAKRSSRVFLGKLIVNDYKLFDE